MPMRRVNHRRKRSGAALPWLSAYWLVALGAAYAIYAEWIPL